MTKKDKDISQIKDFYAEPIEKIFEYFHSSRKGLTTALIATQLKKYGYNELERSTKFQALKRLFNILNNTLVLILIFAAILTFILGKYVDTTVIAIVVVVNTLVSFIQEGKAERAIDKVSKMLSFNATVIRNGEKILIPAKNLVPGDIVILQSGDKIPADLRIFQSKNLQIDEAILTGESYPVEKKSTTLDPDTELLERCNMAYSGTLVTFGQARGIVVATGKNTEIGRISSMLKRVKSLETPLIQKMNSFSKKLSYFILGGTALVFIFGYLFNKFTFEEIFIISISIAVAAIPEGLPIILTITLAIGVERMAKRHVIIRKLPAVETLGSVSVICSDKTGTLTKNEITAQFVSLGYTEIKVTGVGYFSPGKFKCADFLSDNLPTHFIRLCTAGVLTNTAKFSFDEKENIHHLIGDPTEGALLTLAQKAGIDYARVRRDYPVIDSIPFESVHALMATLHRQPNHENIIFIKGAPEALLKRADFEYNENYILTDIDIYKWHKLVEERAKNGERVLLIAEKKPEDKINKLNFKDINKGLTILGLVGMIDPPREGVIHAVKECHAAGIKTKMITGDHALTAQAIGNTIGLCSNTIEVLTGDEINKMDDGELLQKVEETDIFARATPEHKLRLVKTLQALNHTIAMTGDGVNDAPALKRADIGVAMGRQGTEVAKEVSKMVITDDNFASIVNAVKEGRTVYTNLKKAITFILPINGGESLSIIAAVVLGMTLPITPLQILWVNMISSIILAMSLSFEPHEPNIMQRPPRKQKENLLPKKLIWRIIYVSVIFLIGVFGVFQFSILNNNDVETARTLSVNTLITLEVFYLFSSRYMYGPSLTLKGIRGTPAVLLAVSMVILLQIFFTYTPLMNNLFHSRPLDVYQLILIALIGGTAFFMFEFEKLLTIAKKDMI